MPVYYNPLTVIKNQGAAVFCSGAKDYVTDATGVLGYLRDRAVSGSWTGLNFVHVAVPSGGSALPTGYYAPASDHFISSAVTVIGGATPNGDLRIDPTGFIEGSYWNTGAFTDLPKNTFMSGALYAVGIGTTDTNTWTGMVGVGSTDPGSYYQGYFKTKNIHEFDLDFETDTGDLTLWTTGSGVYGGGDMTLSFGITDQNGGRVSSAAEFQENPFLTEQRISILDSDGNMVYLNYRTTQDSVFTFTEQDNINVFGSLTRNFGLQIDTVNNDGTEKKSFFYLYSNPISVERVYVQDGEQVRLNEAFEDHGLPDTSSITSEADRIEARRYFNNQPVSGVSGSGVKDQVSFQFHFDNDPAYTDYSNARISFFAAGDGNLTYSSAGNYQTTEDFLIGSYPLEPIQGGQTFTFTKGDGVSGNRYQNIKYIIENPAGVNFESPLGTDALPVASRVKIVESEQLGIDTLFNVGNQSINGNLVVSGNESGYMTGNCLTIGPPTYDHPYTIHTKDGHVGIGTSITLQAGAKLSVYGRAIGAGDGGRLTGPSDLPYLLSGDAAGGGSQNLQEVTTEGNTTNQGIEVTAGGIKVNDYVTHYGDTDTYAGFPGNNQFTVFTAGSSALDIDSTQQVHFPRRVGIGSSADSTQKLLVVGNSTEIELATTDNYAIRTAQKVDISIGGTISSSGSMIAGGSGNHISGDFDTIAGGTLNNISGGNFNFIGGGSQIDLTGSQYSSSIGGKNNDIISSNYALIGGGQNNKIHSAVVAFIGGGEANEIHDGVSAIGGGVSNRISGGNGYSFIGGGEENEVHGTFSSILGGEGNKVYGNDAVTLGGWFTESTGKFALVGPGKASKVSGDYAVGLGNKVEIPVAHTGATVLADGQDRVHASSGMHTATLDFASGVYVPTIGYFGEGLHVSGVPVLTGENNPAEADTLQTVTTRGNTTTTSIEVANGTIISGSAATTPAADLYVFGSGNSDVINAVRERNDASIKVTSQTAGAYFRTNSATATYNGLDLNTNWFIGQYGYNDLRIVDGTASAGDAAAAVTIQDSTKNVGIGTTSPVSALHVVGDGSDAVQINNGHVRIRETSNNDAIQIQASVGNEARILASDFDTSSAHPLKIAGDYVRFATSGNAANTEVMRMTAEGKVGIGTTNPSHTLDVESADETVASFNSTDNKCAIALNDDDTTVYVSAENSRGALGFQAGLHANNLNIDTAGNVGIGTHTTTTPGGTAKLTSLASSVAFSWGTSSTEYVYHRRLSAGKFQIVPYYGGNVGELHLAPYGENDTPVVIGATDAVAGVKLHVEGVVSGSNSFLGTGVGNRITNNGVPYLLSGDSPAETQTLQDVCDNGNTTTTSILSTGPHISGISGLFGDRVGIGNNNPQDFSSAANRLVVGDGVGHQGMSIFAGTSSSAGLYFADGAAGSAAYQGFIDYRHNNSDMRFGAAGGTRMLMNGNGLLIFPNGGPPYTPSAELEIASSVPTLRLTDSDLTNTFSEIEKGGDYLYFYSRANSSNGGFLFAGDNGTTETEFMRIATDGDVGIGSNVPSAKLDVAGGIKLLDNNYLTWNSSNTRIVGNSDYLQFQVAASDKVRIKSDGSVGIGTTNPTTKLEVSGAASDSLAAFRDGSDGVEITTRGSSRQQIDFLGSNTSAINAKGSLFINYDSDNGGSNDTITFARNGVDEAGTVDMIITEGKVGIGTTDPDANLDITTATNQKHLHVQGAYDGGVGALAIIKTTANGNALSVESATTSDSREIFEVRNSNGTVFEIQGDGLVGIGTTDPDEKLEVYSGHLKVQSSPVGGVTPPSLKIGQVNNAYQAGLISSTHVTLKSTNGAGNIYFQPGNTYRGIVQNDGKMGVNTITPNSTLHVEGDITGAGDVLGTGAGNRITNQGVPYLLSGDSPAETQTLQDVCDNGNTTTTAVNITGAITVANNIFKNVENSFLGLYGGSDTLTNDGFIKIYGNSSNWGKVQTNIGYDATNSKAHWTLNNTTELMTLKGDGSLGVGTTSISNKLDVAGSIGIGASYAGNSAPSNGAIIEGNVGIGTSSVSNKLDVAGAIAIGASFAGSSAPSNGAIIEGNVGIGTSSASNALDVNGHLSATSKSFLIDHPIEENKKLQYACLEGPENGVYVRGTTNSKSIELPEYWSELVHEDSITVVVTPIGKKQDLYIKSKTPELILIGGVEGSYDYVVYGERKDIDKLEIEPLKSVN